ncbi:MAG: hypothetical protein ACTSYL_03910 [Candidatus Thorarchaeota archaeon]
MVDVKTQVEEYLYLLNLKFQWNEEAGVFELIFTERKDGQPVTDESAEDDTHFRYAVYVRPGQRWVQVYADVYPLDKIPEDKMQAVLLDLLGANRRYAEVCFDFEKERGYIGTSQEMLSQGLNFDGFREEFIAVPWAVKKFWSEIAKAHDLK